MFDQLCTPFLLVTPLLSGSVGDKRGLFVETCIVYIPVLGAGITFLVPAGSGFHKIIYKSVQFSPFPLP